MDVTTPHDPAGPAAIDRREATYLRFEFGAVFVALPGLVALGSLRLPMWATLAAGAAICLAVLLLDRTFDRRQLWNTDSAKRGVWAVLGLFALGAVVLGAIVKWGAPELWLNFPRTRPARWAMVSTLYPVLSVYPQNIIYRNFIFHRYSGIFATPAARVWASAGAFAWGHVIFHNWIALALTLAGGLLFAQTYEKHRSGLLSSIEHALYGVLIFTIGLGGFVYLPRG